VESAADHSPLERGGLPAAERTRECSPVLAVNGRRAYVPPTTPEAAAAEEEEEEEEEDLHTTSTPISSTEPIRAEKDEPKRHCRYPAPRSESKPCATTSGADVACAAVGATTT
jgi:hypothetical protein